MKEMLAKLQIVTKLIRIRLEMNYDITKAKQLLTNLIKELENEIQKKTME